MDELTVRTTLVAFITGIANIGVVGNRGRAAITPVQIAMLVRATHPQNLVHGCIVQYAGTTYEEDADLSLVQKKIRYAIHYVLGYNDERSDGTTSEDYAAARVESIAGMLLQTQTLGLGPDVQHSYLQQLSDPELLESEEVNMFHYIESSLVVTAWVPASSC